MKKIAYQKSLLLGFVVVMVISLWPGNSSGEETASLKGYSGPFNPFFRRGAWTTRSFEVVNTTQTDMLCNMGCSTTDPKKGSMQFYRQAVIPPNSQRRVEVAYRPVELSALKSTKKDSGTQSFEQNYKLWDTKTGRQLDTKSANLVNIAPDYKILGVIETLRVEHNSLNFIKDNTSLLGKVKLVRNGSLQGLPDRWYGYSMTDMLLLGGIELELLNESQIDALIQWVRRGGVLILTGNEQMGQILQSRIGQEAGVTSIGLHWIDKLKARDVSRDKTSDVTLDWPMPFVELFPTDAEVLFEANGLPLLTSKQLGEGTIMTLAVPGAAIEPNSGYNVWPTIRQKMNSLSPIQANEFQNPANATLQEIAGRPGPTGIVPASILLGLTGFAIVAGILLRFRRKGEIVWLILIPVSIAIAIGLYAYSRTITNPQRLSNIGLITGLGNGEVRVQQAFAYCSGPENQEPTFTANSLNGLICDTGETATSALEISKVETTDFSVALPQQTVRQNATRRFYVDTVIQTAGIYPRFSFNKQGAVGTITNQMGMQIDDAVLMINHKTYRVGKINAEGDTSIQITPDDFLSDIEFKRIEQQRSHPARTKKTGRQTAKTPEKKTSKFKSTAPEFDISGEFTGALTPDQRRNNLLQKLLPTPTHFNTINAQPLLIGYTTNSIVNPLPDRKIPHEGWSAITWPVTISAPETGSEVLIPAGFVEKQFDNLKAMIWNPQAMEFHSSPRPSELIVMVKPPWKNGRLKDATATITFKIQATGYELTASGIKLDNTSKGRKIEVASRTTIKTFSNPAGSFEVTIPQADRFLDESGWLIFSLDVEKPSTAQEKTVKPGSAAKTTATWKFNSVDVVLKGYAS